MGSGYTIGLKEEDLGIIPRVIRLIFNEVDKRKHKAEFIIKCTFLEIYNEELHDLLDHGNVGGAGIIDRFITKKDITIREEKNGCISVFGLREEKVSTYEELAACLDKGSNFRSTASTLMNNCSSRSHAIFTISIEQHAIEDLYKADGPAKP
jgi:kinesin family protein 4/21/27